MGPDDITEIDDEQLNNYPPFRNTPEGSWRRELYEQAVKAIKEDASSTLAKIQSSAAAQTINAQQMLKSFSQAANKKVAERIWKELVQQEANRLHQEIVDGKHDDTAKQNPDAFIKAKLKSKEAELTEKINKTMEKAKQVVDRETLNMIWVRLL